MNLPFVTLPDGRVVSLLQIITVDRDGGNVFIKTTAAENAVLEISCGPAADAVYDYFSTVGEKIKVTPTTEETRTAEERRRRHAFG